MLFVSLAFHTLIVVCLAYFAARQGLLGKQLKKIAVEMVKEKPPEKPKQVEKPKEELPKPEPPKVVETARAEPPKTSEAPRTAAPVSTAPAVAPPAAEIPSFVFEGGRAVETSSDPAIIYKSAVEFALRSKWQRPSGLDDSGFMAEVEVSIDRTGQIRNPNWKSGSGNSEWDASVRRAIAATGSVGRRPPTNFPPSILVRFDVERAEPISSLP
jgi:hypothetical protein